MKCTLLCACAHYPKATKQQKDPFLKEYVSHTPHPETPKWSMLLGLNFYFLLRGSMTVSIFPFYLIVTFCALIQI